jgi:nucleoside-diphosphate-sugar epimerase
MLHATEAGRDEHRFLITGAKGFIASWIVKVLLEAGERPVILDVDTGAHRLRALLSEEELASIPFVRGDVTKLDDVDRAVGEYGITHVIHMAALQVPFCAADPPLGALVNVVGTVNVFEVAKRRRDQVRRVVYASSAAVFGPEEYYGAEHILDDAPLQPTTHYGVYKQCNEGSARIYYANHGVSSAGIRPSTVYGVGRDQGMTSGPTKAIKACVVNRPYVIGFTGRADMQYARDTASIFLRAARSIQEGASVYTPRGAVVSMEEIMAALERVFPHARDLIRAEGRPLPVIPDVDDGSLRRDFGDLPRTSLDEGVRETAEIFRRLRSEGRLDTQELAQ